MRQDAYFNGKAAGRMHLNQSEGSRGLTALLGQGGGASVANIQVPRGVTVGIILMVALLAFEMFNFDTTRFALENLLGGVSFMGLGWATILAVAFCAIDFAGLIRMFTPEQGADEPKEVWYLMGAWLLGATMNALMTWWAVSLTLLNHEFGNEVLGREQLLSIVPVFVAVLVWLTRILFIGALTVTGEQFFRGLRGETTHNANTPRRSTTPVMARPVMTHDAGSATDEVPAFLKQERPDVSEAQPQRRSSRAARPVAAEKPESRRSQRPVEEARPQAEPIAEKQAPTNEARPHTRVRQRPPMPRANGGQRQVPVVGGIRAEGRNRGR